MHGEEVNYDIKVVNAFKSFGEYNVINGLRMEVRSGSIYGFLGASGCGKSTLLQCILGKISLDSGTIELKADRIKDIGYMPQDLCLEDALTIKEIFEYYGALYSMTKEQIKSRINHLETILKLPDLGQYIKNISGGQSRRVSLAVSIFHDPKIIILDEPTVGMDSLLRQDIWEEFSRMVKQSKKTFIITTHYIEEATKADYVGLMRNGILIEEGTPQNILTKFETDSLESAFLILCCKQENIVSDDNSVNQKNEIVHVQPTSFIKPVKTIEFVRIKALVKKNARMFFRDYLLLSIVFFLYPIIQTTILCLGVGVNIKGLTISVKNDEIQLSDCVRFNVNGCILDEKNNQTMSCVILNYLSSIDYKLVQVNDRDTNEAIVKDQKSLLFLHFPKNYTENLKNYIGDNRRTYDLESSMYVNIDKNNYILKNTIAYDVINSVKHVIMETLLACKNSPRSLTIPIDFNVVLGKEVKSYLNYGAALYLTTGGFYLSSVFAVSLMLSERMDGFLGRSMFAGVTIVDLLTSLFCINTVIYIIQMAIAIFIVYVLFPNPPPVHENCFIFLAVMLLIGWIGFFCGILVAGLFPSKLGAVYGINGLFLSLFMLSGFTWPIAGQVEWMRPLSKLLPTTIAGHIVNDISLRGWTLTHPSVMFNTSMLITQLFLLILVLFCLGKIKKDMWILNK